MKKKLRLKKADTFCHILDICECLDIRTADNKRKRWNHTSEAVRSNPV